METPETNVPPGFRTRRRDVFEVKLCAAVS